MNKCFFSLLAIITPFIMLAQEISSVTFEQLSPYKFSEDYFELNVQTKKGSRYSEKIVNNDVKRLYSLGVFTDVVSMLKDTPDGKKEVVFKLKAKPIVSQVVIE